MNPPDKWRENRDNYILLDIQKYWILNIPECLVALYQPLAKQVKRERVLQCTYSVLKCNYS